jgi:S-DNA-T family DNA segregation ATPase FtsK/SpoIIIE
MVVKGALDSNIPARVGLMMVKKDKSKMLLGQNGAENLPGRGDLLFKEVGDPVRLQAPLLRT